MVQQLPGVPTSLLGLRGPSRNVVANRTFQATNTFWVDPRTGVPVNVQERILSVLHAPGGQGRLMVSNADLKRTYLDLVQGRTEDKYHWLCHVRAERASAT